MGLESAEIVGEAGSEFEDKLGITHVGICPDLGHPAPMLGAAEEGPDDRLVTEFWTPDVFGSEETGYHSLVVGLFGMLAVEANLKGEDGCVGSVLAPDRLRLVVLAWRILRSEPDLEAVAVVHAAQQAEIFRYEPAHGVRDVPEH
jgi:hypothetical protein